MNQFLLSYVVCPECRGDELEIESYVSKGESIEKGRLICQSCQAWYRIQNGILDLLPFSLRNKKRYKTFAQEHNLLFQSKERYSEKQKLGQIDFFAESDAYEVDVTNSPYFRALDEVVFEYWIESNLKPGILTLDIGCGTGRQIVPLAQRNIQVIGVDISEEMLLLARKKIAALGFLRSVDFVICDAEKMPFKDQSFDACTMVGTLHHVHRPKVAIQNAARLIVEGGRFFSHDPHKSPARFIFDWSMKIWKLYDEEARDEPLFTEKQLARLLQEAGIKCVTNLSTYLPLHLFYIFNHRINVHVLRLTDRALNSIPFVRKLGGMVIIEGRRVQ